MTDLSKLIYDLNLRDSLDAKHPEYEKVIQVFIQCKDSCDASLILEELNKVIHEVNELLNKKPEPKAKMVPPKMPDSFF